MAAHEISDGVNCCTPKGQLKRYLHCVGCDQKPSPSPKEQAAELYPKLEEDYPIYLSEVVEMERAAWLSRQAEVDELKRQVEELKENNRQSIELAIKATDDKTFYVDEIRKLLNLYGREEISLSRFAEILNIKAMAIRNVKPVHDNYDKLQAQIAAKEKEIEVLTKKLEICESQLEDYRNMK